MVEIHVNGGYFIARDTDVSLRYDLEFITDLGFCCENEGWAGISVKFKGCKENMGQCWTCGMRGQC